MFRFAYASETHAERWQHSTVFARILAAIEDACVRRWLFFYTVWQNVFFLMQCWQYCDTMHLKFVLYYNLSMGVSCSPGLVLTDMECLYLGVSVFKHWIDHRHYIRILHWDSTSCSQCLLVFVAITVDITTFIDVFVTPVFMVTDIIFFLQYSYYYGRFVFELIQRISHLDSTTCSQSSLVFVDKTVDSTWYFLAFVSRLGMVIVRFQLCHINDYPHVDYVQLVVPWPRLLGLSSTVLFRLPIVCVHLLCHSSVVHHVQLVLQLSNNRCIARSCFCAMSISLPDSNCHSVVPYA